jgi:hypothetical protein
MPRLVWAVPGFIVWAVLQVLALQWCTEWRDEKVKYGFAPLALLLWWLPNLFVGETGASEVEQVVLFGGFPVAALYLGGLLIAELAERRKHEKAES